MKRRSAQIVRQLAARLDENDRNSRLDQERGGHKPDRTGADNEDILAQLMWALTFLTSDAQVGHHELSGQRWRVFAAPGK